MLVKTYVFTRHFCSILQGTKIIVFKTSRPARHESIYRTENVRKVDWCGGTRKTFSIGRGNEIKLCA